MVLCNSWPLQASQAFAFVSSYFSLMTFDHRPPFFLCCSQWLHLYMYFNISKHGILGRVFISQNEYWVLIAPIWGAVAEYCRTLNLIPTRQCGEALPKGDMEGSPRRDVGTGSTRRSTQGS